MSITKVLELIELGKFLTLLVANFQAYLIIKMINYGYI